MLIPNFYNIKTADTVILIKLSLGKDSKVNIDELAREYGKQYEILCAKIDGLRPLLYVYTGEDLHLLRRKIKIYYDMACECKRVFSLLSNYYEEDENA